LVINENRVWASGISLAGVEMSSKFYALREAEFLGRGRGVRLLRIDEMILTFEASEVIS